MKHVSCLLFVLWQVLLATVTGEARDVQNTFIVRICKQLCSKHDNCEAISRVKMDLRCYLPNASIVAKRSNNGDQTSREVSKGKILHRIIPKSKDFLLVKIEEICQHMWPRAETGKGDGYVTLETGNENIQVKWHKKRRSWHDAQKVCKSDGGNLAKLHTKQRNDVIAKRFLKKLNDKAWIGLVDLDKTNHFKWIDGSPITYSNWHRGEPKHSYHGRDEDCSEIVRYPRRQLQWNDKPCKWMNSFLCERQ